jgi:putative transposase
MSRPLRATEGGLIYHVLSRANLPQTLFLNDGDYDAFEHVLAEPAARQDMRLLAYGVMPIHFHLVLWPRLDRDLSRFMRWLTMIHTQRWHAHRHSAGSGHVYQGRFKSPVIQDDGHLLTVFRYIEANPLWLRMVEDLACYRWSSFPAHGQGV